MASITLITIIVIIIVVIVMGGGSNRLQQLAKNYPEAQQLPPEAQRSCQEPETYIQFCDQQRGARAAWCTRFRGAKRLTPPRVQWSEGTQRGRGLKLLDGSIRPTPTWGTSIDWDLGARLGAGWIGSPGCDPLVVAPWW